MKEERINHQEKEQEASTEEKKQETQLYSEPLLKILDNKELTENNFDEHKKYIEDILYFLLGQISFLWSLVKNEKEKFKDENRVKKTLTEPKRKCELLKEYCTFLWTKKYIPEPYQYLWSIAHNLLMTAPNLEQIIYLYQKNTLPEKQEKQIETIENIINITTNNIEKKLSNINKVNFIENWLYTPKIFSPYEESEKILINYTNKIEEKNIEIENTLPEYTIESYKDIFIIAIENLLNNSIKFTPSGGKIRIGIEEEKEDKIKIFIQNTWINIPKKVDVFTNGFSTPSLEGKKGTGIWLSQTKTFIEIAWGNILQEKNISEGAKFVFSLKKPTLEKHLQN